MLHIINFETVSQEETATHRKDAFSAAFIYQAPFSLSLYVYTAYIEKRKPVFCEYKTRRAIKYS